MGQEVTEPTARPLSWPYSTNWSRPPLASSLWFTALAVSPSLAPTKGPPLMGQSQEAVGGVTWPGTMQSGQGTHGPAPQPAGQHLGEKPNLPRP